MPMDRKRYPKEWKHMAAAIKEAAGWKCQKCGKQCRRPGEPFDTHRNTLTVAHLNHTPEDVRPENLLAMCAPCHLRYDAKHHAETRRNRKMKNDTISRQETLEHLRKRLIETAFNNVGYECDAGKVFEDASKRLDVWLSEVPSAQPEYTENEEKVLIMMFTIVKNILDLQDGYMNIDYTSFGYNELFDLSEKLGIDY